MRVLHVEDNPVDRDLTRRSLAAPAPGFDAALLDLRLPDGSGLELLAWIREHAVPTAVVILTGSGDQESALAALKAGADDYLSKDNLERLAATLDAAVSRYRETVDRRAKTIRVLYAEHNDADVDLTRRHLAEHAPHIRLVAVPDARAALDLLPLAGDRPLQFDVVLLDYRLPGVDALDALKQIRQDRRLDIPIILVTGHGNEEVAAQAFRLGVSDYLFKRTGYLQELPWAIEKAQREAELTREISDRKRNELALQQSEEKFREFFMTSRDCVFITTPAGELIDFNDAALTLFGIESRDELARLHVRDLYATPGERDDLLRMVSARGYVQDYPISLRHLSGAVVEVLITTAALRNPDGSARAYVGTIRDISEQKKAADDRERLEAQLRQAQKMDAVGRLAGGGAHDFNNMLNVILGYTDMIMLRLRPDDPIRDDLEEIRQAASRSADLTRQLLAFARRQTVAPQVLDLNDVIGERVKMLRRLIGEDIAFTVVPGANLGSINMDPSQLDQVLANLSVNSRDAIAGVGSIIVETKNVSLDDDYCALHPGFEAGNFVQLVFSDTGCGMDHATVNRIFEPFFTTKETGLGTGLGLATVYGVVKQNGGFINVYSEPGHGTTFRIYLPRHTGDTADIVPDIDESPTRGSETILVVEDEPQILRMCQRVLEDAGYTVLASASPVSAITLAEQHNGPLHLLLSDVVMPGMNGRQLQARLEAIEPTITTLFMSGYTADVVAHRGVLDADIMFLQKPFSRRELARRIREALDQK